MKNTIAILILSLLAACDDPSTQSQCGGADAGVDADFDAGPAGECAAAGGTWIWFTTSGKFTCCYGPAMNCEIIAGDAGPDAQ